MIKGNERGTSVVELGLLAPLLMMFITGIVDLSGCIAAKFSIQRAADRALQLASVQDVQRDYNHLRQTAATYAGVPLGNVTADTWMECDDTRQANFQGSCAAGAQKKRFVKLTIRSSYSLNFPISYFAPRNGQVALTSSSTLRLH